MTLPAQKTASALRSRFSLKPIIGGFEAFVGSQSIGKILLRPSESNPLVPMVARADIDSRFRGMGLGRKLYGEVMRRLPDGRLSSGASVSQDAEGVWQKLRKNHGYNIQVNPLAQSVERGGKTETFIPSRAFYLERERQLDAGIAHPVVPLEKFTGTISPRALLKEAEYAPGLPVKGKITPLPEIKKPELWEFSAHSHEAEQAGRHIDIRFGNPKSGIAHSFVLPKAELPIPGKMLQLIPTSDHSIGYMDFSVGEITEGYGKGKVIPGRRTVAEVYHSEPSDKPGTKLRFNLYEEAAPQEYSIRKDKEDRWFLHNKTQTRTRRADIPSFKPSYKEQDINLLDIKDNKALMPKLDGAHTLIDLQAGRAPRAFSYRIAKKTDTGLIEHTHKIPQLLEVKVPKEFDKTILRAETVGIKDGKPIPAEQTGGLLNAKVLESRKKQEQDNVRLKVFPFSVERFKGKDVSGFSFEEKQKLLDKIVKAIPDLEKIPVAIRIQDKIQLLNEVKAGTHPLTTEGVVSVEPNKAPEQFIKSKITPDFDVYVRDVLPAVSGKTGKAHERAGAISYSWTPDGPVAGTLGGFKHDEAKDMLANPDKYTGRVAKVKAQKVFKDGNVLGALYQPRFVGWHLDKGEIEKLGSVPRGNDMPFKSEAQRRFMYAKHPEIAKRWQKHTPKEKKLPEHVEKEAMIGGFFDELEKIAENEGFSAKSLVAPATGLATALGTYGLLRKFRPSVIPELRALQMQAKNKAFEIATERPQGRGIRSLLFGAKDIPSKARNAAEKGMGRLFGYKENLPNSVVLHHTPGGSSVSGGVNINKGVLPDYLDDKYTFHQLMTQGTGGGAGLSGSVPETKLLRDALREAGGDLSRVKNNLGTDFVIKPRTGSMSKAENLLTSATDARDPRMRQALSNPAEFILQEKIPIKREFRVHMINNVPFTSTYRELPVEGLKDLYNKYMGGGGGAFVPVIGKRRKELEEFARKATEHLGKTPEGKSILGNTENLHHALDIAELHGGKGFRVIESNPTPGTLMNPVVSRKLQQMITGRTAKDVAALGAATVGTGTSLGVGQLTQLPDKVAASIENAAPLAKIPYQKHSSLLQKHAVSEEWINKFVNSYADRAMKGTDSERLDAQDRLNDLGNSVQEMENRSIRRAKRRVRRASLKARMPIGVKPAELPVKPPSKSLVNVAPRIASRSGNAPSWSKPALIGGGLALAGLGGYALYRHLKNKGLPERTKV